MELFGFTLQKLGTRYAYRAAETGEWYWVRKKDIVFARELEGDDTIEESDKYSHWCSGSSWAQPSRQTLKRYGLLA